VFRIKHHRSLGLAGLVALLAGLRNEGATFRGWISIVGSGRWFGPQGGRSGRLLMLCNPVTVFGGRVDMDESMSG
jgi:hypothetical protein